MASFVTPVNQVSPTTNATEEAAGGLIALTRGDDNTVAESLTVGAPL